MQQWLTTVVGEMKTSSNRADRAGSGISSNRPPAFFTRLDARQMRLSVL
jgi:hypothetical protein